MLQGWLTYIIIAVVALVLVAVTVVLARLAWRHQVRGLLVGLVGRRAAIGAALKTADSVVLALARGSVSELLAFAEPGSEERRAVAEIADRMRLEMTELNEVALPKRLWPLADELTSAARELATESGRVGDAQGEAVLDALLALDLTSTRDALKSADGMLGDLSRRYGLTDSAVYGGGLYI